MLRLLVVSVAASALLVAQPVPEEIAAWRPPQGEARTTPKQPCASLRALTGFEYSIIAATAVPASGTTPEFCRVLGLIQPEVRFEVALPASWHGRLLMAGNGGYAGEDLENSGYIRARDAAVSAGFAFARTNTGHDATGEPLGAFATSPQKLVDYAFRAVHVTNVAAKKIAAAYYGSAPKRSYFTGCSTGGRQALISAQRFPEDFDGISAGAPVLDFVSTMLNYVALMHAYAKAPVSSAKLEYLGTLVYAKCDELDGVKDGIIENPRRCAFDPAADLPKCTADPNSQCFIEGEVATIKQLYSDQTIAGKRAFPPWPLGIEALGSNGRVGWYGWFIRDNAPPLFDVFSQAFFRYLALPKKDPDLTIAQVDPEQISPRLDPIRRMLNATDTNLTAFRDRGGKLLMWFGWSDPALNPNVGVEYYEAVAREMGSGTRDFFRLFMMPGVFHCSGGPGCDMAPRLAALIDWVENKKAPDQLTASRLTGKPARTRLLCPYPQVAKYRGAGSADDAASFTCAAP